LEDERGGAGTSGEDNKLSGSDCNRILWGGRIKCLVGDIFDPHCTIGSVCEIACVYEKETLRRIKSLGLLENHPLDFGLGKKLQVLVLAHFRMNIRVGRI